MTVAMADHRLLIFGKTDQLYRQAVSARFAAVPIERCDCHDALGDRLATLAPSILLADKFDKSRPFPRDALTGARSIRWISLLTARVEHMVPWDDNGPFVTNISGIAVPEMAHYVLAGIFGLHQGFARFFARQAARHWDYRPTRSAKGITVGLIDMGHTG